MIIVNKYHDELEKMTLQYEGTNEFENMTFWNFLKGEFRNMRRMFQGPENNIFQ